MYHFPLVDHTDFNTRIEFSHFSLEQKRGAWKKENRIILDHIKINIFVSGDFSVFIDGMVYAPVCGDICVLPPLKLHCGQIIKPTYTDYFQIDIGEHALDMIPGGRMLLKKLVEKHNDDTFSHFKSRERNNIIELCNEVERAIMKEDFTLAFAVLIELLSKINSYASTKGCVSGITLSKATLDAIKKMETNYETDITLSSLANDLKISPSYLSRLFKNEVGIGVHEYLTQFRVLKASKHLQYHSVTEVGVMCGFSDTSHFIATFKKRLGVTPKEYKKMLLSSAYQNNEMI